MPTTLGRQLVSVLPPQEVSYQFAIVDQFEPNAFASPGGFIYVSRGLLVLATSDTLNPRPLSLAVAMITVRAT